jgi:hypothetical protein
VEQGPNSYHEHSTIAPDGSCEFDLIPPGRYVVRSIAERSSNSEQENQLASKWRMVRQEIIINGDAEVVLPLTLTATR